MTIVLSLFCRSRTVARVCIPTVRLCISCEILIRVSFIFPSVYIYYLFPLHVDYVGCSVRNGGKDSSQLGLLYFLALNDDANDEGVWFACASGVDSGYRWWMKGRSVLHKLDYAASLKNKLYHAMFGMKHRFSDVFWAELDSSRLRNEAFLFYLGS